MAFTSLFKSLTVDKVQLKVMVDKENNRVLWAEAGKDFVDVLFSFLTLPLGTIVRLVSQKSNIEPVRVGSLSSLYQSVANFNEEYLWTKTCKEMLLWPRNPMEGYCNKLKLNIDNTPVIFFHRSVCNCDRNYESGRGNRLAFTKKTCSYCGKELREASPGIFVLGNGFVKERPTFIISDDLHVMPYAFGTTVGLLQKFGAHDTNSIKEQMVDISKKEVIDLLKLSLLSETPLTDLIMKKKQLCDHVNPKNQPEIAVNNGQSIGRKMSLKLTIRKSSGNILFAEGEEDFADLILSFLTFPLGGVLNMLEGSSFLTCLDNLYKSLIGLCPDRFFLSNDLKDKLAKPQCFPKFELSNQILPIGVASLDVPSKFLPLNLIDPKLPDDPKLSKSKSSCFGDFVKGLSAYMVTDDLAVTPLTTTSGFSYLNSSKVPLSDLEERVIQIGVKEGLCLLKASLISTSCLTNGLKQFISVVKEK